jgi:uncharacterized membrane protein YcaP (DUF421 family)
VLNEVLRELGSSGDAVVVVLLSTLGIYASVIVSTRTVGPRALAQMSAFDFVATVAVGSMIASVGLGSVPLVDGVVAVVTLFVLQFLVASFRRTRVAKGLVDNEPLLLLRDGEVYEDNLARARITLDDLRSHLRRSNVDDIADVQAVVLETTGDVSVLYGGGDIGPLLQGVRGADGHEGPRGQLSAG